MNKTQMIKRAYVRGLAARGIYRARLRQKQAAGGLKDYAISGGVGAAGGSALAALIGGLVQYARGKNVLRGAGIGAGIGAGAGLLGGLGYQYSKKPETDIITDAVMTIADPTKRKELAGNVGKKFRQAVRSGVKNTANNLKTIGSNAATSYSNGAQGLMNAISDTLRLNGGSPAQNAVDNAVNFDEYRRWLDDPFEAYYREAENERAADTATGVQAILDYAQGLQDDLDARSQKADRRAANREMGQNLKNTLSNASGSVLNTAKKNTQKAVNKVKSRKRVEQDGDPDSWINMRPGGYN